MALLLYINMNCLKLDKEVLVYLIQFVVDHTIGSTCVYISFFLQVIEKYN